MERRSKWRAEIDARLASGEVLAGGACGAPKREHNGGGACRRPAGWETSHVGSGRCKSHGGNSKQENTKGAWVLAHEMARALNVSPMEALLGEVRRTAGTVAFLDRKVAEAPNDESLLKSVSDEDGPGYARWVKMRLEERQHLARVSKLAADAGIAGVLVAQFVLQGELMARLVGEVLGELGLSPDQEELAGRLLRSKLLEIDAASTEDRVIEGDAVEVGVRRR